MRILFLNTNLRRGGVERRTLYLAKAAGEAGHEYKILTINSVCDYSDLLDRYHLEYESALSKENFSFPADLPTVMKQFRQTYKSFRPDIVQVFNFHSLLVARLVGMKKIIFGVANAGQERWSRKGGRSTIFNLAERWALGSDKVYFIACSKDAASAYGERFHIPAERICTVANGIDTNIFTRKARSGPSDQPKILAVGTLSWIKNYPMTIKALACLREQGVDATLTVAGVGPEKDNIKALARELHLVDHVKFLGTRQDVAELYHQADIFWMTSRKEGFGQVVVESFLSGVPVLAADVEGIRTLIQDGTTGFLVSLDDAEELASKTRMLLEDENLYRKIADHASAEALEKYTAERMAESYFHLYEQLQEG